MIYINVNINYNTYINILYYLRKKMKNVKVMENDLENKRQEKQRKKIENYFDKKYEKLYFKHLILREKSLRILQCGGDGQLIGNEVQEHLLKVIQFFYNQLLKVNSKDSTYTSKRKTFLLEYLKKILLQNVSQMDEWIGLLINTNKNK